MNADDFSRQHPKLARDIDITLTVAQYRIEREQRPRPVWTASMVRTAVTVGFYVGVCLTAMVWIGHSDVSRWWLLIPGLLAPAMICAARDEIRQERAVLAYRAARVPAPRRDSDGHETGGQGIGGGQ